ncbi:discoidin domain-containing protein [Promicromonospora panici]|uniref:discoidin domain-containing protein n=1 Tax=Promicromonospora panici TaxID=2219658 RepID=UPI0013ED9976|nr:discoidin domain-containing protein [Promicromonospora panici]
MLSEGRPALALTRKSDAFLARHAVDGNHETRWTSRPEDPQWLRVDLEQAADVQRVEIDWGAAYSTAYSIQISDDGAAWSTSWFTDGGDGGKDVITVSGDGRGRYVRMRSVTRGGSAGIAIRETRVYGWRENEEPVETGIPVPAPGVSPKPSNPSPKSTPTLPPAPATSSPPTAPATTAPTPSTRPSPAPSRRARRRRPPSARSSRSCTRSV